jgi:recombination DNA repair RAD52 pathway protein
MDEALRRLLDQPVNPAIVSQRPGPNRKMVKYIEGNTLFLEASRLTAGFGGWYSRLIDVWFVFPPSTWLCPH